MYKQINYQMKTKQQVPVNTPIAPSIRKLELWDKIAFPVRRVNAVRVAATNMSLATGKKFSTRVKRDTNEILVVRVK